MVEGRIQLEKGYIVDADEPLSRIDIDRAEFNLEWDATRQALVVPFQIVSGGNRITLFAQLEPPREGSAGWALKITGGTRRARHRRRAIRTRSSSTASWCGLRIDPDKQRIDVEQGEIGNTRPRSRDLRRPRLFLGRAAARARHRRHAHVGRGDEAAVAVLHQPEGARLGRRSTS